VVQESEAVAVFNDGAAQPDCQVLETSAKTLKRGVQGEARAVMMLSLPCSPATSAMPGAATLHAGHQAA
jgi:hypothetical protein